MGRRVTDRQVLTNVYWPHKNRASSTSTEVWAVQRTLIFVLPGIRQDGDLFSCSYHLLRCLPRCVLRRHSFKRGRRPRCTFSRISSSASPAPSRCLQSRSLSCGKSDTVSCNLRSSSRTSSSSLRYRPGRSTSRSSSIRTLLLPLSRLQFGRSFGCSHLILPAAGCCTTAKTSGRRQYNLEIRAL